MNKQKIHYNRSAHHLWDLKEDDNVNLQKGYTKLNPGYILRNHESLDLSRFKNYIKYYYSEYD